MARLVVFRGEARESKSLDQLPVRLGRGPQNDIVLEDPAKSVSRVHAEIRLEGGRYVLVDLKSDNGIWVAGSRVARVELKPNVVASIGPFRLQLETDDTPIHIGSEKNAGTHPVVASQRPNRSSTAPRTLGGWTPRAIWAAVIATGLATAAIVASVIFLQPSPPPAEPSAELIGQIAAAKSQISQGLCAEALARHIDPALTRDPGNTDLLALKRQAEACVPAPLPDTPVNPHEAALRTARELIAANDCAGALDPHINNVLSGEPGNLEALDLKIQAEACVKSSEPGPRSVLAKKIPPADGGLDPLAGEQDEDYRLRVKAMRARYDEAVATASKGPSRTAISLFEGIAKETPPGYLDVSAKLSDARGAWRATALPLVTEARELAAKEMWNEALQKLKEARGIDSSLSVDDDVRDIEAGKLAAGQQACRLGKQTVNYDHAQGVQHFRRAIALLPPDDPCYAAAKKYVDGAGD